MENLLKDELQTGSILNINKPLGWTSFDVVRYITTRYKCKAGHAGTLDPMATGVLVVCTGKKTKEIETIQSSRKEYLATIHLGITRPSFDVETAVNSYQSIENLSVEDVAAVLKTFIGEQEQVPPLFSAKKVNGVAVYELARKGLNKELKSHLVVLHDALLLSFNRRKLVKSDLNGTSIHNFRRLKDEVANPACLLNIQEADILELRVKLITSKGFYVRSFARDLAYKLNTVGTLNFLTRTAVGNYKIEDALSFLHGKS